jgi:biopolymer transport protein ExbD
MAQKYSVTFSDDDMSKFALMESFGVPIQSLKQILDMKSADRTKADQPGIPKDSLDNQLADWVQNARIANIEINDKELQIAIKGDAKEEYPAIRKVMDILQEQEINSFNLVTGLRGKEK